MNTKRTTARNHSVPDFAATVGIGLSKTWAHIRNGDIPVVYFGRIPKITDETTERILREGLRRIPAKKPKAKKTARASQAA